MTALMSSNTYDKKGRVLDSYAMNNEAQTEFNREVQARKQLTYSARHRKCGSRSKKCTFPSDYMSKKEKEKMNGEVQVYHMGEMISFDEFLTYPADIQQEYIASIQCKYSASKEMISNMFALPVPVFDKHTEHIVFNQLETKYIAALSTAFMRRCINEHTDVYQAQAEQLKYGCVPICWYTFQTLSILDKEAYLDAILQNFNISLAKIADMFGVKPKTIDLCMKRGGSKYRFTCNRTTAQKTELFTSWLDGLHQLPEPNLSAPVVVDLQSDESEYPVAVGPDRTAILNSAIERSEASSLNVSGTLVFTGSSADAITKVQEFINKYMIAERDITITLEF